MQRVRVGQQHILLPLNAESDLVSALVQTLGDLDEPYAVLRQKPTAAPFEFKAKINLLEGQVKTLLKAGEVDELDALAEESANDVECAVDGLRNACFESLEEGARRAWGDRA